MNKNKNSDFCNLDELIDKVEFLIIENVYYKNKKPKMFPARILQLIERRIAKLSPS